VGLERLLVAFQSAGRGRDPGGRFMKPTLSCPLLTRTSWAVRPPDTSSGTTEV
jgi:hypothetical protein